MEPRCLSWLPLGELELASGPSIHPFVLHPFCLSKLGHLEYFSWKET